jgi:hypothetical protein
MSKSKSISVSDLASLIASARTGYIAEILAEEEAKALAVEKSGSNAATRKANLVKALVKATKKVKGCTEDLAPAAQAVRDFLPESKVVAPIVERVVETGNGLDDEEIVLVAKQVVDGKQVKELVDATYDAAKAAIFRTMDLVAEEAGEEFPEHTNVEIEVVELGKKLVREGAGRKDASLDEELLRDIVGEDVWSEITSEHVVRVVDEEKLAKAALKHGDLLEQVREATRAGGWKSPRLMVRDITPNES